jgi:hypothetical protein
MYWPAALETATFEQPQQRLTQNLREAVESLKKGERPSGPLLKDIQSDFATMNSKLNDPVTAEEIPPTQFVEARRYMRQVDSAIKALRDPRAVNYFNDTWKPQGRTVAELVENMTKNGLEFAAATPGDEAAYSALYQAMRSYEGGLQLAMNQK